MSIEQIIETRNESLQASPALEELLDVEFEAYCAREADENVTLDQVRQATSSIPGSMAQAIVDDERAERF